MKLFEPGQLNLIIDLQWGSTGKGAISRHLAEKEEIDVAICHFSPNSAHTSVEADGTKDVVKQLPQAAALVARGADIRLMIGADACINPDVLEKEISTYKGVAEKLTIHPNAVIITPECIEQEKKSLVRISSTLQGTAYAKAMKITRAAGVVLAKDHAVTKQFVDSKFDDTLLGCLSDNKVILGDFHQGYELSMNGPFYPFVTSSTVNTSQFLASCNLPPGAIGTVVGTARTYAIRVGNVKDESGNIIGYSGDVYPDQKELTWDEVTQMSGSPTPLLEHTTLTNKVRRIFTFSHSAFKRAVAANDVDFLFLNFANYIDHSVYGTNDRDTLLQSDKVREFMLKVQNESLVRIQWVGCGPQNNHIVEM